LIKRFISISFNPLKLFLLKKEVNNIIENVHDEKTKKIRRKIEEKLRKDLPPEKILALATLLDITPQEKEKE